MIDKVAFPEGKLPYSKGMGSSQKSNLGVLPNAVLSFGKIIVSMVLGFVTGLGFLMILLMIAIAVKIGFPGPLGDRLGGIVSVLAYAQGPITTVFVTLAILRQEKEISRGEHHCE
ncbi:MAG: hypothetical protein P1V97_05660 [Planctomycetota bacterium]|nr:hypothetical protein [Planctomycetota bacterium]